MHAGRRTKRAPAGIAEGARAAFASADPSQWSDESKRSVAIAFRREYRDQPYLCWHCRTSCVFTAQDHKYTFEVRKANVNQRRALCEACWMASHRIRQALRECEAQWITSKAALKTDRAFLDRWLALLVALERYVADKADTARKNMLTKLLSSLHSG